MRIKITNTENLERDICSMGIVNTDKNSRERYLRNKERILSEREEMERMKTRLNKLEEIVSKLQVGNTAF